MAQKIKGVEIDGVLYEFDTGLPISQEESDTIVEDEILLTSNNGADVYSKVNNKGVYGKQLYVGTGSNAKTVQQLINTAIADAEISGVGGGASSDVTEVTEVSISCDSQNVSITDGRSCQFIAGGSYMIKGTGNATINVSFDNDTFDIVSYGFMWSWASQKIAKLTAQNVVINQWTDNTTNYRLQGGTFQRINKRQSTATSFIVETSSAEEWTLYITKYAERLVKPKVKPLCIIYDGGRWQGKVYWKGQLYKIWDLHRLLDIPYAVALYSDQIKPSSGNEYTCEEVFRDIESGLCEVMVRNATAMKVNSSHPTDQQYLDTIDAERNLLGAVTKATILGGHHLDEQIYRCSIKDGADFIRQYPITQTNLGAENNGVIAYKNFNDASYMAIHNVGVPSVINPDNNFWLPEIMWAHGVGITEGEESAAYSSYYSDKQGTQTEAAFQSLLDLVNEGKLLVLHPSDFSAYCKTLK